MAEECFKSSLSQEAPAVRVKTEKSFNAEPTIKFNKPKPQVAHGSSQPKASSGLLSAPSSAECKPASEPPEPPPIDEPSVRGIFGWATIGGVHLPYILRGEEKFVAARMMECKLIYKYLGILPWSIFSCTNIKSYYITETEAKLLNEINGFHCEYQFGYELFVVHDVVVPLKDAIKLYEFLETCQKYLVTPEGFSSDDKCCGYVLLCGSPVPYIKKEQSKFVPVELVQNEVMLIQVQQRQIEEWDAAYLRFLCIVIGQDASRIKVGSSLCSTDELKWDSWLCPLHIAEWKPPFQTPLLNMKKLAGQSIYSALNTGYLFGSGGDWNSVSKFAPQEFDSVYAKQGLNGVGQGNVDGKMQKFHSSVSSTFVNDEDSQKNAVASNGSKSLHSANNYPVKDLSHVSKAAPLIQSQPLSSLSNASVNTTNKSLRETEPMQVGQPDASRFIKPTGPPVSSSYPAGAFISPSLKIAESPLKSNLLPGQQLCNQTPTNTFTALMQDPFFLQWYSSALVTGTLGLSSLMPPVCGNVGGNEREALTNAMYSLHGMQNYSSSANISASPAKLSVPNTTALASLLSTPSPHYPTPPQSCPLTMHLSNSSMFPGNISSNDMTRLPGKVDFCSPPPTPEGLSMNNVHLVNPQAHEDMYITPDDHGTVDRGRSECTAQETVVDGHLLTAAVDSHQATRCSVLITDISRILPGLSKELCSFALENLLGKSLPVCNRLQAEAFAKKGKCVSEGEKLVDVEELKVCLPQLKLLLGNMQNNAGKSNEQMASFTTTT